MKHTVLLIPLCALLSSCEALTPIESGYFGGQHRTAYQQPYQKSYQRSYQQQPYQNSYQKPGQKPLPTGPYNAGNNRTPWWADVLFEAEDMDIAIARKRAALGDQEAIKYLRAVEKRHEWQKQHWNDPAPW
ncbi:hypothetical protein DES53_10757 [Roseimicrobium gellanilyticum]|uniref:Lipoprotein n=1 Tax=Roseimicrobium gellanilyticum TaxID=748857 RepID=A0A366HH18_9BACT|nr:hypothetical protein [Roseimicrobium gellanilyticum]RBP41226.1 hypothetical protein DES53_10757 [Roseimicrobium gellanilyticum]